MTGNVARAWRLNGGTFGIGTTFCGLRSTMGIDPTASAQACEHPSLRRRSATKIRSDLHGRDLLRAAHRLSVERAGRHRDLPFVHRSRSLSAVGRSWRIPGTLEGRAAGVRRAERDRLGLAESRRAGNQVTAERKKNAARI